MLLFHKKLPISFKLPFNLENHHRSSEALSASLLDFRSKTTNSLSHILLEPRNESESMSLACFELMQLTNRAFAEFVVEIDYPMSRWGGEATQEYLNYTLILLNMLNSISSSIAHLNQAKISITHGLSLLQNSPTSAAKYLKKIAKTNLGKDLGLEPSIGIEIMPGSCKKESVILQSLITLKKISFLEIGLVLSGLDSSSNNPCLEIGKFPGGSDDDPLERVLESRFFREGSMKEVEDVNQAIDKLNSGLSSGRSDEAVARELKGRLKVLETSIQCIERESNNLFSHVMAERNKLLDNIRFKAEHT